MKNITRIFGLLLLIFTLSTNSSFAQGKSEGKGKANKEKVKKDITDKINELEGKSDRIKQKGKKQEKANDKKVKKDITDKIDELEGESDRIKQKIKKKEKTNKGNAYGRNKDDMSGKEFGKLRALDAKAKIGRTKDYLNENEEILRRGRKKVEKAKEKVLKESAEKGTNKEDIKQKEEKIKKAEDKLNELEKVITRGKEKVLKKAKEIENVEKSN